METRADVRIPFDRLSVRETYRDRLVELVPYLPDVRSIEVKERRERGGTAEAFNVWRGGGEIPAAARSHARRHRAVTCEGAATFVAEGGQRVHQIRGSLRIDGAKPAGVPRLTAGAASRAVEDVFVKKITPNLAQARDGGRRCLVAKRMSPRGHLSRRGGFRLEKRAPVDFSKTPSVSA